MGGDYEGGPGGRLPISALSCAAYRWSWAIDFHAPTVPAAFTTGWRLAFSFCFARPTAADRARSARIISPNDSGVFSPRLILGVLPIHPLCLPRWDWSIVASGSIASGLGWIRKLCKTSICQRLEKPERRTLRLKCRTDRQSVGPAACATLHEAGDGRRSARRKGA